MKNITAFNRTILLLSLVALAGFLAKIGYADAVQLIACVAGPIMAYVGLKGKGSEAKENQPPEQQEPKT